MARKPATDKATKPQANPRGVVMLKITDDLSLPLMVTMGAMADIEDAFDCDFDDLDSILTNTKSIAKFLAILSKAGGRELSEAEIDQVRRAPITIGELMANIRAATTDGAEADAGNAPALSA